MVFLLSSVSCSVLVSVLLKLAARRGLDAGQMVTWNYLVAAALCAWGLAPPLDALRAAGVPHTLVHALLETPRELWIAALSVSFLAAAVSVWLLLLLASSNAMRLREALWNAVCLSLGRLPRSLLAVLFTYGIAYGMFLLYPVSLIPCIVVVLSCMAALTVAACYQPLWDLVLSQWPDEPDSGDDGTTP